MISSSLTLHRCWFFSNICGFWFIYSFILCCIYSYCLENKVALGFCFPRKKNIFYGILISVLRILLMPRQTFCFVVYYILFVSYSEQIWRTNGLILGFFGWRRILLWIFVSVLSIFLGTLIFELLYVFGLKIFFWMSLVVFKFYFYG